MAIIGIDLGTTNCLVSTYKNGKLELIPNVFNEYLTPSVVSFDNDEVIIGKIAKERLVTHPETTFSSYKQYMGKDKVFSINNKQFSAEGLSALVLRQLKEDAERYLNEEVTEAIISVPAYFDDIQRVATRGAGELAGLKVERILNEPSAAALAYKDITGKDGLFIVFDFGGGTLDISLVEVFENIVDIIAVSGDNHLGGDDIDNALLEEFLSINHLKLDENSSEMAILKHKLEQAKISLSRNDSAYIEFEYKNKSYSMTLDLNSIAQICSEVLYKIRKVLNQVLSDSRKNISEVDKLICVGGSSKNKFIQDYLLYLTNLKPDHTINPDEAIAYGVGVASGIKSRNEHIKDMILTDICPFSLGTGTVGDIYSTIIPKNCSLPTSRSNTYCTTSENQEVLVFDIYQGEHLVASSNNKLGSIRINIPRLPKGKAQAQITYSYDINGILDVEVKSLDNNNTESLLIVTNDRLSKNEIEAKKEALNKIKLTSSDDFKKDFIMSKADRIYMSANADERLNLNEHLRLFNERYDSLNMTDKVKALKEFEKILNSFDETNTGLKGGMLH